MRCIIKKVPLHNFVQLSLGEKVAIPDVSIGELFFRAVEKFGNKTAVIHDSRQYDYCEIDKKSNSLACEISLGGVEKGDIVFCCIPASVDLIISLLAIMKSGAVYVPVDCSWPISYLKSMIDSVNPKLILIHSISEEISNIFDNCLKVDYYELGNVAHFSMARVEKNEPVYGIFTSGSTGKSKCCLNTSVGLLNRLQYMSKRYGVRSSDVILLNSKPMFDASLWQILWPLLNGAMVVVPKDNENFFPPLLCDLIETYHITMTDFIPSVFQLFTDHLKMNRSDYDKLKSLRQILIGGEKICVQAVNWFKTNFLHVGITNTYGPAECSIGTIFYEVNQEMNKKIPIGTPIDNVVALILDDYLVPVAFGEPGEIYLGGICVGLGYLNNPKITVRAFVKNTFCHIEGAFIYRTGDRGRYMPDGTIEFLGRLDSQIKINGRRLEIDGIENAILSLDHVRNVYVFVNNLPNHQMELCACVRLKENIDQDVCMRKLSDMLPSEWIPARVFFVENWPLNTNGKTDCLQLKKLFD